MPLVLMKSRRDEVDFGLVMESLQHEGPVRGLCRTRMTAGRHSTFFEHSRWELVLQEPVVDPRILPEGSLDADDEGSHRVDQSDFRPYLAWASAKVPDTTAAMSESSRAAAEAANTSASLRESWSFPSQPSSSRFLRWAGSRVPPPMVPMVREGRVTRMVNPAPSSVAWLKATAFSATQAVSWPVAR